MSLKRKNSDYPKTSYINRNIERKFKKFVKNPTEKQNNDVYILHEGTYNGEWNGDKREGNGKMTYDNGDVYEGEWENDEPKKGRRDFKNNKIEYYDGEWKDGMFHGQGTISYGYDDHTATPSYKYKGVWYEGVFENNIGGGKTSKRTRKHRKHRKHRKTRKTRKAKN